MDRNRDDAPPMTEAQILLALGAEQISEVELAREKREKERKMADTGLRYTPTKDDPVESILGAVIVKVTAPRSDKAPYTVEVKQPSSGSTLFGKVWGTKYGGQYNTDVGLLKQANETGDILDLQVKWGTDHKGQPEFTTVEVLPHTEAAKQAEWAAGVREQIAVPTVPGVTVASAPDSPVSEGVAQARAKMADNEKSKNASIEAQVILKCHAQVLAAGRESPSAEEWLVFFNAVKAGLREG